jgi:hypothetical protein
MEQLFPTFIESESLRGLRSLMVTTSLRLNGTVKFFSVYQDSKTGNHVAWFYDKFENIQAVEKGLKDVDTKQTSR